MPGTPFAAAERGCHVRQVTRSKSDIVQQRPQQWAQRLIAAHRHPAGDVGELCIEVPLYHSHEVFCRQRDGQIRAVYSPRPCAAASIRNKNMKAPSALPAQFEEITSGSISERRAWQPESPVKPPERLVRGVKFDVNLAVLPRLTVRGS